MSCQHFAFAATQFLVISMGVTTFLIVFVMCYKSKESPKSGAWLIGAAGVLMILAGSIEILGYLHNSQPVGQPGMMGPFSRSQTV